MSKQPLTTNSQGMVAITTTLIIMILITLIVSSFSLVVRREQRQSLDRQLSTQAFYAAESGVQDAINAINRGKISSDLTECDEFFDSSLDVGVADGRVSADSSLGNVEYSCVLVDTELPKLNYGAIDPIDGTYLIPINPPSNRNIDSIKITWKNVSNPDNTFAPAASVGNFPKAGGLPTGAPRVTLLPQNPGNRQDLNDRTRTYFMYPNADPATNDPGQVDYDDDGAVVGGNCRTSRTNDGDLFCASEITSIGGPQDERYYLAVRALYQPIQMQITATDTAGNNVNLSDAQYEIDVTGRAADVLRRIRVSYSQPGGSNDRTPSPLIPTAALETTKGICKKFEVAVTSYQDLCGGAPFNPEPDIPDVEDPEIDVGIDVRLGDAAIGNGACFPPGRTDCSSGGGNPNAPLFEFNSAFPNASQNDLADIAGCIWSWGDGTSTTLPPRQCMYGVWTNHLYEDTRNEIIQTNGQRGCRIYRVRLTMQFNGDIPDEFDDSVAYVPRGQANDAPNPVTGTGICVGKYRTYTP